eukprot:GHVS01015132.1.p2 GENE.GHVS01015132.1~~GHVS01015132.1.p2  ORF type:complete len:123 (-),score=20.58 GHVS01015132.1:471-839(-)
MLHHHTAGGSSTSAPFRWQSSTLATSSMLINGHRNAELSNGRRRPLVPALQPPQTASCLSPILPAPTSPYPPPSLSDECQKHPSSGSTEDDLQKIVVATAVSFCDEDVVNGTNRLGEDTVEN